MAGDGQRTRARSREHPFYSGITILELTPRLSYLPFDPFGSGWYRAALEPGLEGWFEYYLGPKQAAAGGLKAALRLHGVGFGRVVPYLELTAGAGGTGPRLPESQSTFTFILEGGAGASVFLSPDLAITAGYRIQHLSNGNTSKPNRGSRPTPASSVCRSSSTEASRRLRRRRRAPEGELGDRTPR